MNEKPPYIPKRKALPQSLVEAAAQPTPVEKVDPATPEVGKWYWLKVEDGQRLVSVTHIGSNYYEVRGIREPDKSRDDDDYESEWRVHFDEWDEACEYEPNAKEIIAKKVKQFQGETQKLLEDVREITLRLSVDPTTAPKSDAQALTIRNGNLIQDYKKSLVVAKEKILPDLFDKIAIANKRTAAWMKAELIPLRAQASALKPVIKAIEHRIFSVEIYAGLVEEIVKIQDGDPADKSERVRIYQRRRYMDEECLAQYETGGMTFENLEDFDKWLLRPGNLSRLLPSRRSIVAFKVRRKEKSHSVERDFRGNWRSYVSFLLSGEQKLDELTYLYMRNGQQVYRLGTEIDFKDPLFPAPGEESLFTSGAPIYASHEGFTKTRIKSIISEGEYEARRDANKKEIEDKRKERADWWREVRKCAECRKKRLEKRGKTQGAFQQDDRCDDHTFLSGMFGGYDKFNQESFDQSYTRFDPGTVYYDDIAKYIEKHIQEYNLLVLLLQGLFDRSPVFVPHPPAKLYSATGFQEVIELVYDDTRALNSGRAPVDFEEYRARLNSTLKVGDVVIGQQVMWMEYRAQLENKRRDQRSRYDNRDHLIRFQPDGNPGPGWAAKVVAIKDGKATFTWARRKLSARDRGYGYGGEYSTYSPGKHDEPVTDGERMSDRFTCDVSELLNVSAYTPGDFHLFFDDPRTRTDYLEWAPWLLEAEEVKAGNRRIREPLAEKFEPKPRTYDPFAAAKRERAKRRRAMWDKSVTNRYEITTTGGQKYPAGMLWRAAEDWHRKGKLIIRGIRLDGSKDFDPDSKDRRVVGGMDAEDLALTPENIEAPQENPQTDG